MKNMLSHTHLRAECIAASAISATVTITRKARIIDSCLSSFLARHVTNREGTKEGVNLVLGMCGEAEVCSPLGLCVISPES